MPPFLLSASHWTASPACSERAPRSRLSLSASSGQGLLLPTPWSNQSGTSARQKAANQVKASRLILLLHPYAPSLFLALLSKSGKGSHSLIRVLHHAVPARKSRLIPSLSLCHFAGSLPPLLHLLPSTRCSCLASLLCTSFPWPRDPD